MEKFFFNFLSGRSEIFFTMFQALCQNCGTIHKANTTSDRFVVFYDTPAPVFVQKVRERYFERLVEDSRYFTEDLYLGNYWQIQSFTLFLL